MVYFPEFIAHFKFCLIIWLQKVNQINISKNVRTFVVNVNKKWCHLRWDVDWNILTAISSKKEFMTSDQVVLSIIFYSCGPHTSHQTLSTACSKIAEIIDEFYSKNLYLTFLFIKINEFYLKQWNPGWWGYLSNKLFY